MGNLKNFAKVFGTNQGLDLMEMDAELRMRRAAGEGRGQ